MNRYISYTKVIGLAIAALAFTACSEQWDDHYTDSPLSGANSGTLWQAIEQNDQLSNFKRVVEACEFDKSLKSSQAFTVFAPTNAHFLEEQADSVINLYNTEKQNGVRTSENRAVKEFLQNHIARYTHSVAKESTDSIIMLNGKYMVLTPKSFGGHEVVTSNQLFENGVLFTVDKPVEFYNNIFEYIRADADLDKVEEFVYDTLFYKYELDENQSVAGDIINGKTTYLDSVMVKSNNLFYYWADLGWLNTEDSTYWMVLPDNQTWDKLVQEYEPYFQYNKKVSKILSNGPAMDYQKMNWIMPRLSILAGTTFSVSSNPGLRSYSAGNTSVRIDSLMSTYAVSPTYRKGYWGADSLHYYQYGTFSQPQNPFAAGGVFDGATFVECSNGKIAKTSQWPIKKQETFAQEIIVEAETAQIFYDSQTTHNRMYICRVSATDSAFYGRISNNMYLEINPKDEALHNPDVAFYIPNVLSNVPYDIYMVMVPANAEDPNLSEDELLPTQLEISRLYKDLDGNGKMRDDIEDANDAIFSDAAHSLGSFYGDNGKGYGYGKDIDTLCLGKNVIFPTCTVGLDNPEVQIRILSNVFMIPGLYEGYSRTLRIDCIIFKPRFDAITD
jgi:uncharacterized surface protein with fasciclin (FAS1) repeats